jgi:two-component system, NtrC family, response regulator AtoC
MTQSQLSSRVGVACYPRDGFSPEALLGAACERVRDLPANPGGTGVIVQDARMRRLYQLAEQVAVGTINVLVTGETGVGKEILAEAIHKRSPRSKEKYVCINCAAFSETLLESELFGHEKGAFTGATEAKAGLLETAPGGTIFLDEIGEIPLPTQAKLLRVIETHKLTRVGSLKERAIDVRFVAATNRDLAAESAAGRFRKDLYFRLNGITLAIPPLRERRAEIEPLARTFVDEICARMKRMHVPVMLPTALELLQNYSWPGNIRELRNIMERAVLLAHDEIGLEQLPVETMLTNLQSAPDFQETVRPTPIPVVASATGSSAESERDRIVRVLDECGGNQSRAAKRLGIARSTLVIKLDGYRVPRPRKTFE